MVPRFPKFTVRLVCCVLLLMSVTRAAHGAGVDFVVHISVDGLRGDLLKDLIDNDVSGDFANFQRFVDEGATTFNARTDFTHTNTLPSHVTMLTGRPVLQPAGQPDTVHHGYTNNSAGAIADTDTLHNQGNPNLSYIASAFDIVHDNGLSTGLYASKGKFVIFEQSYDATGGAPDTTGDDNGTDKIDMYVNMSSASVHAAFLTDMAANHFDYSFVHYSNPDEDGHTYGWGSTEWNDSVADVDGYLGGIFSLIATDPLLDGHTALILSADHGGTGTSHGTASDPANYTIPFLVWGPGVGVGLDLYDLNTATRLDPGALRPDYDAAIQPIRNGDGANLGLDLLGLGAIPGSTINADQSLSVIPLPAAVWMALPLLGAVGALKLVRRRGTPGYRASRRAV